MGFARTCSVALVGVEGVVVEVQAGLERGVAAFTLVGLPDKSLVESRDRVRAAVVNSGEEWPQRKLTVGLSPASVPKGGSGFDLAVAGAVLAAAGATHGEPGHTLTGTTPLHAADQDQPERPAYVYVTEVAHTLADGRPALFGGGFYARGRARTALLPRTGTRLPVLPAPPDHIDYYRLLAAPARPREARTGDTALLAFRTQIFVTRSTVAVVAGLSTGRGRLLGLYDSRGRPL